MWGGSALAASVIPRSVRAQSLSGFDPLKSPAIAVKSPTTAFLVGCTLTPGGRLVAVGEHGVIIYSDDNGQTWHQANVPVNVTITCVNFATARRGWAAGHFGVILITDDGGKTWITQLNGIQAAKLTLEAAQNQDGQDNSCPCTEYALKRAEFFVQAGPDKPFLCIIILSPQEVIVFGAYRLAMRTTDGGKTWTDWSLHIYDKLSHNLYDAATIGSDVYLVAEKGLVFVSKDHANTFLPLAPTSDTTLFGILGCHGGGLLVYGVAGVVFRSVDKGQNWLPVSVNVQDDITSGCVLFSGEILLATESGVVLASKDNGITFTALSGLPPRPIYGIQKLPDDSVMTVGADGVALISNIKLAFPS